MEPTASSGARRRSVADLEAVLAETFRTRQGEALAYCVAILGDADLAQDAVQAAFVELLRRIRLDDAAFFDAGPWEAVKRNLRWASLKLRRERGVADKRLTSLEATPERGEERWRDLEGKVVATDILHSLPTHMTQVLRLRLVEDEPDAVSAATLGITVDAFRCRYKRALFAARSLARSIGLEGVAGVVITVPLRGLRRIRNLGTRVANRTVLVGNRLADGVQASMLLVRIPLAEVLGVATAAVMLATSSGVAASVAVVAATTPTPRSQGSAAAPASRVVANSVPKAHESQQPSITQPLTLPSVGSAPVQAPLTAAQETPEDTHLFGVTSPSGSPNSNWLVAIGWGVRCACSVVFQSSDGGATWRSSSGPPLDNGQEGIVSLPPNYPADPRIFLSGTPGAAQADYISNGFGSAFTPMPVAAGAVSLGPRFDRGEDLLFVAAGTTVWGYRATTGLATPIPLDYAVSRVDAIDTPQTASAYQAYVVADVIGAIPVAGGNAVPPGPALFGCGLTSCVLLSSIPLQGATGLSLSPAFPDDHTLVVTSLQQIAVSRDSGKTFTAAPAPSGTSLVTSKLAEEGSRLVVWAIATRDGSFALHRADVTSMVWSTAMGGHQDASPTTVSSSGASRILAPLNSGGLRCSNDGGQHWAPRCAAAGG